MASNRGPSDSVTALLGKHGVYYETSAISHNTQDLDNALTERLSDWPAGQI